MGPDPTRAYFWPAVNKRPTCLQPRYFLTQPEEIFFDPKVKKFKNLTFLGEIFQIQTQTINGWPNPGQKNLTRPDPSLDRSKCFNTNFTFSGKTKILVLGESTAAVGLETRQSNDSKWVSSFHYPDNCSHSEDNNEQWCGKCTWGYKMSDF